MKKNDDLNRIMQHYRKEVKKNLTSMQLRRLLAIVAFVALTALSMQNGWYMFYSFFFLAMFVAYKIGAFNLPPLAMNDAFLAELAKLDIQDKEAYDNLKTKLKSKAYLLYDEVEDFIEREVATRALNAQLDTTGAKALLSKDN